jgi:hypothetical protein
MENTNEASDKLLEYHGELFCVAHYAEVSGHFCYACKTVITDKVTVIIGRRYHAEHIGCDRCGTFLTVKECRKHVKPGTLYSLNTSIASLVSMQSTLSATSGVTADPMMMLVCVPCHEVLKSEESTLVARRVCATCHLSLEGERAVVVHGERYHYHHFRCAICSMALDATTYGGLQNELHYCSVHFGKQDLQSCKVCNLRAFKPRRCLCIQNISCATSAV